MKNNEIEGLLLKVEMQADEELRKEGIPQSFGYCHFQWERMKRILKEEYGIDWKTPAEENPHIDFD